ncbi:MAG: DUF72 domain-containing protein [Vicinamibacterales bacterium]
MSASSRTRTWIGISGWTYDEWRGRFYPDGLPRTRQLAYAARRFNSIELNGTFYSLKRPEHYRAWHDEAPSRFVYAVKGGRFITHDKKLRDIETPLANFFASGVLLLGRKLGPIFWQLPASARYDAGRMERFFELLPQDTAAASALARRHDERLTGRSRITPVAAARIRHAIEVRHESFFTESFVRLARRFGVAIITSDAAGWPAVEEVTADFVYIRLHGHEQTYASKYDGDALAWWADRIRRWREGREPADARRITDLKPPRRAHRDVYVYFDNDIDAHAPADAIALAGLVGADPEPAGPEAADGVIRPAPAASGSESRRAPR